MYKLELVLLLGILSSAAEAQLIDPGRTAERKATDRANNRIDQSIDKGLDKMEEGIGNIFKKKKDKEQTKENQSEEIQKNEAQTKDSPTPASSSTPFLSYSKFDFIAGEKVLYFDNFERVDIGDFPADFNTDASGELVKIEGKEGKWLNMTKNGMFIPEAMKALPENCTLEFEIGIDGEPSENLSGFGLVFKTTQDELMNGGGNGSFVSLHPAHGSSSFSISQSGKSEISNNQKMGQWNTSDKNFVKVSIWKQKGRMRLYVNESKLWDIPRFFSESAPYYVAFTRNFFYDCNIFITNINYAVGAPDTRNKLLTEGKFTTNGILFDINSDRIKAESYGVLKEIARVLTENTTIHVLITGHTDNDGDDNSNLVLSKKRAVAVKNSLVKDFGIDSSRLETDGKGESSPIDNNTTLTGKANNRRVEFTKL